MEEEYNYLFDDEFDLLDKIGNLSEEEFNKLSLAEKEAIEEKCSYLFDDRELDNISGLEDDETLIVSEEEKFKIEKELKEKLKNFKIEYEE